MTSTSTHPTGTDAYALSREEIAQFHRDGYLGPLTLCEPDKMAAHRQRIDQEVLAVDAPLGQPRGQSRHLDNPTVYALCSHPTITDRMASLMGPGLVLWRSHFFNKEPGGSEIPWHQDLNYWPIEPPINLSAWLAIDDVTTENACPRILPGSHRKVVPHIKALEGQAFGERADPDHYDETQAVDMVLKPGQFFLFTERLLHHSFPNHSDKRRLGLAVRVTVPFVRVEHDKLFDGHKAILMRGEDPFGFNRYTDPPTA